MWLLVLAGNLIGVTGGAAALAFDGVFDTAAQSTAISIAQAGLEESTVSLFSKGAFAGVIIAGVVWLDFSVRSSAARFALIYLAFLSIPLGNRYHVVVSSTEVMYLVFIGETTIAAGASPSAFSSTRG
jgi:formate/nitrite transporter FocA (FNT family)